MQKVKIVRVNLETKHLIEMFIDKAGNSLESFRYFSSRPISIINNHLVTLILMLDGIATGYAHLDKEQEDVWLGIAVAENAKGKGFGKLLIKELLDIAKEYAVQKIKLTVDNNNVIAQKMYKHFGFELRVETKNYCLMELNLEQ